MEAFSWLQYDFMKYAFLAILIITPLFGLMGTMIVNRKMAFFSDALQIPGLRTPLWQFPAFECPDLSK